MGMNLAYKILNSKLKEGKLIPGEQIGSNINTGFYRDYGLSSIRSYEY